MPKIVVISNSYSGGGAELVSRNLVRNLHSERNECSLITINDWPDDFNPLPIRTLRVGRVYRGGVKDLVTSILRFRRIVLKERADFAVINCEIPELFSVFLPVTVRRIVVEHTSNPWVSHGFLGKCVRKILNLQGAIWVRVSQSIETFEGTGKTNFHISNPTVHNISDLGFSNQKISRLLFIGRLVSLKQPELVISAAQSTGIPALIVGEGAEEKVLIAKANAGKVKVDFYGLSQNPWDLVEDGDILIFPSKFEGDGLVISEAIIVGLPILVLDVPDLRRFNLPDLNYFADQAELNSKILEFNSKAYELVVPNSIRDIQVEQRLPKNVVAKWEALIEELTINP